jgi:hypothetical protein
MMWLHYKKLFIKRWDKKAAKNDMLVKQMTGIFKNLQREAAAEPARVIAQSCVLVPFPGCEFELAWIIVGSPSFSLSFSNLSLIVIIPVMHGSSMVDIYGLHIICKLCIQVISKEFTHLTKKHPWLFAAPKRATGEKEALLIACVALSC